MNIEPNHELMRRLNHRLPDDEPRDFAAAILAGICLAPLAYVLLWLFML